MKQIQWNSKMRPRGRVPSLWVLKPGEKKFVKFPGESMPGTVTVLGTKHTQNGKWSGTAYDLAVSDGVVVADVCTPFDGWGQTWRDARKGVTPLAGVIAPELAEYLIRQVAAAYPERYAGVVEQADAAETALRAAEAAEAEAALLPPEEGGKQPEFGIVVLALPETAANTTIRFSEIAFPRDLRGKQYRITHAATASALEALGATREVGSTWLPQVGEAFVIVRPFPAREHGWTEEEAAMAVEGRKAMYCRRVE